HEIQRHQARDDAVHAGHHQRLAVVVEDRADPLRSVVRVAGIAKFAQQGSDVVGVDQAGAAQVGVGKAAGVAEMAHAHRVPYSTIVLPRACSWPSACSFFSTRPAISREQPTSRASSCRDTRSWVPCGWLIASGSRVRSCRVRVMRSVTSRNASRPALRLVSSSRRDSWAPIAYTIEVASLARVPSNSWYSRS